MTNRTKAILITTGICAAVPVAIAIPTALAKYYPQATMVVFAAAMCVWMVYGIYSVVKHRLDSKF